MKNLLLAIIVSLTCISVSAQEKKNAIKILPVSFSLNSAAFEYERMLNEKNAFEFGIGLPINRSFVDKFGMTWSEDENITDDELGIFSLRAAYRHYTGKSSLPKGFYIAPFIKYQGISGAADNVREIAANQGFSTYNENVDAKIHTIGAGCQLGYQFLISKTVSLDLFFFGLEAGLAEIEGNIYVSEPEQVDEIYNDVLDAVDDLPSMWKNKIEVSSRNQNVSVKAKNLFYPMFRGGISLGIAF
ncbi:hypothetical protein [Maribellus sp. YY47]|uniref:hypothetical protein n=1 Tax=Maribellus sp. YY47 TaxID=2929486 RepID=UPI002000A4AA|nr:hypothetical protein [Maribellus sp. YY47]MCK3685312.1 hypothetical protein [Maribellus sp. YY47]